jgi:hypothetical protein
VLAYDTSVGAVVVPAGGGAAVTLSGDEGLLWHATAEPVSVDTLASLVGDETARAGVAALAGLGVLREVV